MNAEPQVRAATRGNSITLECVSKVYEERGLGRDRGVPAVTDVSLSIRPGEFLVLVGPSGCGKSTLLRMIAGLEVVSAGTISMGGRDVTELHPRDRDIAMVFQNYALYPHMTVAQNLGYALKMRKVPKDASASRVASVAKMLGLSEVLQRRPGALSGGQRQRVAMGRAIVREPAAFLMDEPLSNLDAKLRVEMRTELARLHKRLGITTVYVTHDQVEAMTLGDRVAVMHAGRIQQVAAPQELYHSPRSLFVASFIGSPSMNLVEAEVDGGAVRFGGVRVPLAPECRPPDGVSRVILGIRPEHFEDARFADPSLPTLEVIPAVVEQVGADEHVIFRLEAPPVRSPDLAPGVQDDDVGLLADEPEVLFNARVDARSQSREGVPLRLVLDPAELHFFDPDTGESLARSRP
jgi:multiple sugar transport system ATP-binding protein